jgi:hypothetical protein
MAEQVEFASAHLAGLFHTLFQIPCEYKNIAQNNVLLHKLPNIIQ